MRKTTGGFTIVELLVVMAVIGTLSTISVIGFSRYQADVRDTQRSSKATILAEALEKYYDNNGEYPGCPAITNPIGSAVTTTVLPGVELNTLLTPKSAPTDTNSIKCQDLAVGGPDIFAYVGDGSDACNSLTACLNFTLKYKEEATNTIQTLASRRNTNIATSGDTTLTATTFSNSQINLGWTNVDNAANYTLQRATDSMFTSNLTVSTVTGTTASATGLATATLYYFRIMPNTAGSSGNWSNMASATTDNNYGSLAVATSIEGYWTTAPAGFLLEDGSAVSRTTYDDLFAAIGTTYGVGNGSTTFNLPDSRGRTAVNKSSDTEFDTIGEKSGSKAEALTTAQMPSHTHTQNAHTHGVSDPSHNHWQNAHWHEGRSTQNGDFLGLVGGGQGGWGLASGTNNNIYQMIFDPTIATNNSAYTGIGIYDATATNQSTGSGSTHNEIQPSIVKLSAIKYTDVNPLAATLPESTSIQGYWSAAPSGYLLEDGTAVSRATYATLFAAIGTTYGAGNGSTTFNLPDSRGRTTVNKSSDTEFDTIGEKSGSKAEALTTAQMPSHTHTQNAHTHGVSDPGHNHTQNPHTHDARSSQNGDRIGLEGGGQGGWGLKSGTNNNIYQMGNTIHSLGAYDTAANVPEVTGISLANATATNQSTGSGSTHNNIQPSIVKMSAIKTTAATLAVEPLATASSISGYWSAAPSGYLLEDGTAVSRATYATLFAAIGTTYGVGNGSTTFNLPDSRGRTTVNKSSDTEFDTIGEKSGSKAEALTTAQMPSHTHTQNAHTHGVSDPGHNHWQDVHWWTARDSSNGSPIGLVGGGQGGWGIAPGTNNNIYWLITTAATATNVPEVTGIGISNATATNQSTGSGSTHNNIQPSIVKLFAIKH